MEEISSDNILSYLKTKYLSKPSTKSSVSNDDVESKDSIPAGDESEDNGEEAENRFLVNKLNKIQGELVKWLDVLKGKING